MNKEKLIKMYNENKPLQFIGFFGGLNAKGLSPEVFSNFYPSTFSLVINGTKFTFSSNEQFFMWYKAKKFNDEQIAKEILALNYDPKRAKALGRKVSNYDDKIWDSVREKVMYTGLKLKFSQNPDLKKYLLETGDKILVETSPWDKLWGCGMGIKENYSNPLLWKGSNKLGFLLMKLRMELNEG